MATPTVVSSRGAAIERAVVLRAAYQLLAREYVGVATGLVLAITVRCAQDLRRAGCSDERYPEALEARARAVLVARSA